MPDLPPIPPMPCEDDHDFFMSNYMPIHDYVWDRREEATYKNIPLDEAERSLRAMRTIEDACDNEVQNLGNMQVAVRGLKDDARRARLNIEHHIAKLKGEPYPPKLTLRALLSSFFRLKR